MSNSLICCVDIETWADRSVWLCSVWWKTACQMRHAFINLGCWPPLSALWRDKWIHCTVLGRLAEPAACRLLLLVKPLMNRLIFRCITFELSLMPLHKYHSCLETVAWRKDSQTLMETIAACPQTQVSIDASSLSVLCCTKKCILWTLFSEIMAPLIGWSVTNGWLFKFQGEWPFHSETLKGPRGDVTVASRGTMWWELVFIN